MDIAPTPTARSRVHDSAEVPLWRRPAAVAIARGLAVVAGTTGALAALTVAGFIASVFACDEQATGLCTRAPAVVHALEWALVAAATLVPFIGGIAACVRRQGRWLALGLLAGALLVGAVAVASTGQSFQLS